MKSQRESRLKFLHPITVVIGVLLTFSGCAKEPSGPERRNENGVEVVINGDRPYPIDGKLATLTIKEEFRIDLEDPKYAEMGLSDVAKADLDSQGRVVLFRQFAGEGPLVFIFDERGSFLRSFGRRGQGPGEVSDPFPIGVTGSDEIAIRDSLTKILFFDSNGTLLRTASSPVPILGQAGLSLLANGNYLIQYPRLGEGGELKEIAVGVFDPAFRKIKDIAAFDLPGAIGPVPVFCYSGSEIFLGFEKNGTDISVFDLNGDPIRIIRKRYPQVSIPSGFLDDLLKRFPSNHPQRANLRLPAFFPAFQCLYSDSEGRLYVATSEKDVATGQNICEIFSPDGTFIRRAALGYFDFLKWIFGGKPGDMVIRDGRVLCVRDKDNGYREVIVSSIKWE